MDLFTNKISLWMHFMESNELITGAISFATEREFEIWIDAFRFLSHTNIWKREKVNVILRASVLRQEALYSRSSGEHRDYTFLILILKLQIFQPYNQLCCWEWTATVNICLSHLLHFPRQRLNHNQRFAITGSVMF